MFCAKYLKKEKILIYQKPITFLSSYCNFFMLYPPCKRAQEMPISNSMVYHIALQ